MYVNSSGVMVHMIRFFGIFIFIRTAECGISSSTSGIVVKLRHDVIGTQDYCKGAFHDGKKRVRKKLNITTVTGTVFVQVKNIVYTVHTGYFRKECTKPLYHALKHRQCRWQKIHMNIVRNKSLEKLPN